MQCQKIEGGLWMLAASNVRNLQIWGNKKERYKGSWNWLKELIVSCPTYQAWPSSLCWETPCINFQVSQIQLSTVTDKVQLQTLKKNRASDLCWLSCGWVGTLWHCPTVNFSSTESSLTSLFFCYGLGLLLTSKKGRKGRASLAAKRRILICKPKYFPIETWSHLIWSYWCGTYCCYDQGHDS